MNKIKVIGRWEIDWSSPNQEIFLWNLLLRDFQIEDWYMWPIAEVKNIEEEWVHLHQYNSLEEILDLEENRNLIRIYFEPEGWQQKAGIDLRELKYEDDKKYAYIFGSAHYNPLHHIKLRPQDIVVTIKTLENKGVLWPHQCVAIVLYDKMVRS